MVSEFRTTIEIGFLQVCFGLVCLLPSSAMGQILDEPADRLSNQLKNSQKQEPVQVSSKVFLQQGGATGYLVVAVKLSQGKHIYSLTQGGSVPPTSIKLLEAKGIELAGKFSPDKPPKVIEKDPELNARVEKHTKQVQFFAPIKIKAEDPKQISVQLDFRGLVCGEGSCMPLRKKLTAKFSGYFNRSASKPRDRGTSQRGVTIK